MASHNPQHPSAPPDRAANDAVALTQALVHIDSSSPALGSTPGPGEAAIAQYIKAWLEQRGIETHWIEPTHAGALYGVTLLGYDGDALSGTISDGKLYGRGAADISYRTTAQCRELRSNLMKSGLAAAMVATAHAKQLRLRGDVILAAVADEEAASIGTEQLLAAGWRADAAIVPEPTEMAIINRHKGFAVFEVDILGVASHGSRADLGVDAICKAGYFLVELDRHAQELQTRRKEGEQVTEAPNIHCGIIKGGEEFASYPAKCTIFVERRTVAGETKDTVRTELLTILDKLAATVPDFKFELRTNFSRAPYHIAETHDIVQLASRHAANIIRKTPKITGVTF